MPVDLAFCWTGRSVHARHRAGAPAGWQLVAAGDDLSFALLPVTRKCPVSHNIVVAKVFKCREDGRLHAGTEGSERVRHNLAHPGRPRRTGSGPSSPVRWQPSGAAAQCAVAGSPGARGIAWRGHGRLGAARGAARGGVRGVDRGRERLLIPANTSGSGGPVPRVDTGSRPAGCQDAPRLAVAVSDGSAGLLDCHADLLKEAWIVASLPEGPAAEGRMHPFGLSCQHWITTGAD